MLPVAQKTLRIRLKPYSSQAGSQSLEHLPKRAPPVFSISLGFSLIDKEQHPIGIEEPWQLQRGSGCSAFSTRRVGGGGQRVLQGELLGWTMVQGMAPPAATAARGGQPPWEQLDLRSVAHLGFKSQR